MFCFFKSLLQCPFFFLFSFFFFLDLGWVGLGGWFLFVFRFLAFFSIGLTVCTRTYSANLVPSSYTPIFFPPFFPPSVTLLVVFVVDAVDMKLVALLGREGGREVTFRSSLSNNSSRRYDTIFCRKKSNP